MDDSPRSSKRRKIDTPKRIALLQEKTTPPKPTPTKPTRRAASTRNGASQADTEEKAVPKRGGRLSKSAEEAIDIYDDIEGALSVKPPPRPARAKLPAASRAKNSGSEAHTDEIQATPATVKRARGRPSKADSASRSAFRDIVQGYKAASDADADTHDELAAEEPSPTKRATTARTPAKSARKPAAPRPTSTKRTPARTKKQAASETEDELAHPPPTSTRKRATAARRRSNRTDHIDNEHYGHSSDVDKENSDLGEEEDDNVDGNSIVGSVLDPTEPSPFNKPTSAHKDNAQKDKLAPTLIFGDFAAGKELDLLKTIVMDRITGKRPAPLVGLDDEYKSVHQVVEHTITAGEGNSMLVIGARGSGKTALVNKVLSEVAKDNGGEYHVVRLNGFIHTDDKIALREIWRQLGKEMDIEDDGSGPGKNYADTLATLLALLSHPSELTGEVTEQVAKAVIFVMDEFDLFAQHPRQTLLYNLFDIAQSRKAPIAVLGLTTRIDVTNSLEKRVKSRFSHRYVHLSLAKTFTAFQEICKACLLIQPDHLTVEERGILESGTKTTTTPAKKTKTTITTPSLLAEWNTNISKLFLSSTFLTTHLAPTFYTSKSAPQILTSFLVPTATLSPTTPLYPSPSLTPPDSKLALIPHLSTLSLSLLIAAARLDIIHDTDTANFNMAYDEYVTLASRARIQSAAGGVSASSSTSKVWGKDVARREWEGLIELGLVMPVVAGQGGAFGMVRCDVSLEEIGEVLRGVKERGLERWCRSI
ncbi:hypothetical protein NX059_004325 [Plenodomus lindquistii]|nr:hypothetical protein NX059_004325 [Plenodomus lindquistii]